MRQSRDSLASAGGERLTAARKPIAYSLLALADRLISMWHKFSRHVSCAKAIARNRSVHNSVRMPERPPWLHDARKARPGHELHDLSEQSLACVHTRSLGMSTPGGYANFWPSNVTVAQRPPGASDRDRAEACRRHPSAILVTTRGARCRAGVLLAVSAHEEMHQRACKHEQIGPQPSRLLELSACHQDNGNHGDGTCR